MRDAVLVCLASIHPPIDVNQVPLHEDHPGSPPVLRPQVCGNPRLGILRHPAASEPLVCTQTDTASLRGSRLARVRYRPASQTRITASYERDLSRAHSSHFCARPCR